MDNNPTTITIEHYGITYSASGIACDADKEELKDIFEGLLYSAGFRQSQHE